MRSASVGRWPLWFVFPISGALLAFFVTAGLASSDGSQTSTSGQLTNQTFASLTFDAASADQYSLRSVLAANEMGATFYTSSGSMSDGLYYPYTKWDSGSEAIVQTCGCPRAWIDDPAGNVRYEAHHYWDADGSGTYQQSYKADVDAAEAAGCRPRSCS